MSPSFGKELGSAEGRCDAAQCVEQRRPLGENLYFDGCPNHEPAVALVERVDRDLGSGAEVRLVNVPDREAANRLRFLGSPTIRVDGVDPLTEERNDYALSCRIFTTDHGPAGQPEGAGCAKRSQRQRPSTQESSRVRLKRQPSPTAVNCVRSNAVSGPTDHARKATRRC